MIPNTVTNIGSEAFARCAKLTSVTIPGSVTSIGDSAFADCTSLTSVAIPEGVTNIGDDAFENCIGLTKVTIPDGVTSIGYYAFSFCTSLTNVTIPNSITNIMDSAFADCISLTSITMPNSVTSIGNSAFADCANLKGIYFNGNAPGSVGLFIFFNDPVTVYYLPGTTGWDDFAVLTGVPTALWLPQMLTAGVNSGVQTNQFGFNINWASGQTVVVEACTNLANPDWQPVGTNTLTDGSAYFSDPQWTNYPGRFYRLRSP